MSLRLAYNSTIYQKGMVEDLMVHVGNFIIPVDFVISNVYESSQMDNEPNVLLSSLFIASINIIFDVHIRSFIMKFLGETITH